MIKEIIRNVSFGTLLVFMGMAEVESSEASEEKQVPMESHEIYASTLENGLKFFLKPTQYDKNEVYVQLITSFGYSCLGKEYRPSGILSPKIAMESGFGKYTSRELTYRLYRDSIDFSINVHRSYTLIDISCPPESLENALSIIELVFNSGPFNQNVLSRVVEKEKLLIREQELTSKKNFECAHFALNTLNSKEYKNLTLKSLRSVDLEKSFLAFQSFFSSPESFIAVIVGDFEPEKVKGLVSKRLGSLQKRPSQIKNQDVCNPKFPEGVTRKVIYSEKTKGSFSKLTIPFNLKLNPKVLNNLQIILKLLEKRFQKIIFKETGKNPALDINYEIPFYPNTDQVWVNIQFHCPKSKLKQVEKLLMDELYYLQNNEINETELQILVYDQKNTLNFWKKSNSYWQSTLANYSLWKWDFLSIEKQVGDYSTLKSSDLMNLIKEGIPIGNYTIITIQD